MIKKAFIFFILLILNRGVQGQSVYWSQVDKFQGLDIKPLFIDSQYYWTLAQGKKLDNTLLKYDLSHNLLETKRVSANFKGIELFNNNLISTITGEFLISGTYTESPQILKLVATKLTSGDVAFLKNKTVQKCKKSLNLNSYEKIKIYREPNYQGD